MDFINKNFRIIVAGMCGLIVSIVAGGLLLTQKMPHHPVGTSHDKVIHVHGDFRMYIGDTRIRFTDPKYQSTTGHAHHASLHFHDGNDEVIHRHADNVTFAEFFDSLGMKVTNDCLTLDTGTSYCTNATGTLMLLVNNQPVTDIEEYIFAEEDRILLYYGDPKNPNLKEYTDGVTDLSCLYSGTCLERGAPPTEGCGLTCEVADNALNPTEDWLHSIKNFITGE